ncbi:MAG TPA: accessory factor UbiK family protein [Steroidobacteraceae bacterium]|nr:accessory factor UbiK family protein [Steroidobacteraceae bacterium]
MCAYPWIALEAEVQNPCHARRLTKHALACIGARALHHFGIHAREHARFRGISEGRTMENVGIDDIARQLFERLPEAARTMRRDIESNFRAVLQASLGRLDLVTRTDFDVQSKVLERTRARLEQMEARMTALERRLQQIEESVPPPAQ